jgi:hypothetical protein
VRGRNSSLAQASRANKDFTEIAEECLGVF